jgi:hypothetical protein
LDEYRLRFSIIRLEQVDQAEAKSIAKTNQNEPVPELNPVK